MLRIILVTTILISLESFAQTSKKEYWAERAKLQPEIIQQGQYLDKADLVSVEKFMSYYLEVGPQRVTKQWNHEHMNELFADSSYIYFGHYAGYTMLRFWKVEKQALAGVSYKDIDGRVIRERFIKEIVPEDDKARVEKKEKSCTSSNIVAQFSYKYLQDARKVEISYRWKIGCDFLYKIINKTYTAHYSFDSNSFSN